jgi:hypothetical protein
MKKQIGIIMVSLTAIAGLTFGQETLAIFNSGTNTTSGTFNSTDSFSLDVFSTYAGYNSFGLSYWVQLPNSIASQVSLTNVQYFTFTDPNASGPATVAFDTTGAGTGADSGFTLETRDLGGTVTDTSSAANAIAPGTYHDTTFTVNLNGLAPGTYQLESTVLSSRISEQSNSSFSTHAFDNQAVYTFTVVPEPPIWSLMSFGALGSFGLTWLRARRRS